MNIKDWDAGKKLILILVICAIPIIIFFASVSVISSGTIGIVSSFGRLESQTLSEGIHFVAPWKDVYHFSVADNKINASTSGYTKDFQQASIVYQLTARANAEYSIEIFRNVRLDWLDVWVKPIVERSLKEVIGRYEAISLIQQREKAALDIIRLLNETLQPKGIEITNFSIINIDFSAVFEKAVEEKLVSQQNSQKAQYETIKVQEEAKQTIIKAKAEAESLMIKGRAITSNPKVVELEAINKWDGVLPSTISGVVPFLNIQTK